MSSFIFSSILVLIGAYSMAAQIFFIRELLVQFFGSELCLGIIFSCWFFGIAWGAWFSGRFCKTLAQPRLAFLPTLFFLTIAPFILIPLMRGLRSILMVLPGEYISFGKMILGAGITVAPFSFIVGFLFPIACRTAEEDAGSAAIGKVYVWESLGSLLGGVIISLAVIPIYSALSVFGSIACMLWAAMFCFCAAFIGDRVLKTWPAFLALLTGCMLVLLSAGAVTEFENYLVKLRWNSFQNRLQLLASRDSRYQNIVIAGDGNEYGIFTDGQLTNNYPDEYPAARKAHLFMCQHPAPERVLLIGGGLTGLIRNILQHPVKTLDYIELDPEMTGLVMPILGIQDKKALSDQRVTIIYMDGRRFVKSAQGKYDLIIIQAPEPATAALNRFYTVEFYREIKRVMAENGVMVTGLPVSTNYEGGIVSDYAASLYEGLRTIFPCTLVIPQEEGICFFAAQKPGITTPDYLVLKRRYQERGINSALFTPELFRVLVQEQRIASMTAALGRRATAGVNSDLHPITYFYQLLLWQKISGNPAESGFFPVAERYLLWWIVSVLVIVCLLFGITLRGLSSQNALYFSCLWVIGVAGCTGMALELVLIFMLQNMYGYIYQMIGIIAGSFMFGLTAGGYLIKKLSASRSFSGIRTLLFCEIALCLYAVLLPFTLPGLRALSEALHAPVIDAAAGGFMLLVFIAGFITGMEFPLVSHILVARGCRTGTTAGRVDAADHFGAFAGSLLTGALLVPLAGVYQTCFIMGLLNASGAVFLLLQMRIDKN